MAHNNILNMKSIHACKYPGCNKLYANLNILKRHVLAFHKDEGLFKCSYCGKFLASKQNLKEHEYIHTGEKPYKCKYPGCSAEFRQGTHLSAHKKNEHSEYPISYYSKSNDSQCIINLSYLSKQLSMISYNCIVTGEAAPQIVIPKITGPYYCHLPSIL